jgi:hypothetical protein
MSPARCNPIWPLCIHEIHAIVVGLLVGLLVVVLLRRSTRAGTILLTTALVLAWTQPVHLVLKPWYVLGGASTVIGLSAAVRAARRRQEEEAAGQRE